MWSRGQSHHLLHLLLLVVLIDSNADPRAYCQVLVILLLLVPHAICYACLVCLLLGQPCFNASLLDASVQLLSHILLDFPSVCIDELFDLQFSFEQDVEIIFSVIDHIVQLEKYHDLLYDFMHFV